MSTKGNHEIEKVLIYAAVTMTTVLHSIQSCKRASYGSPSPARARHLFLKPDLDPNAKFTE